MAETEPSESFKPETARTGESWPPVAAAKTVHGGQDWPPAAAPREVHVSEALENGKPARAASTESPLVCATESDRLDQFFEDLKEPDIRNWIFELAREANCQLYEQVNNPDTVSSPLSQRIAKLEAIFQGEQGTTLAPVVAVDSAYIDARFAKLEQQIKDVIAGRHKSVKQPD